ncbi:integrase catalytic subunit [Ahrensia sp. R2A130]|nr:integrase catalytic subunit [Ahrensia sp. R2A130]
MQRFRSIETLQKFSSVHASVHNHFNQQRHLTSHHHFKANRDVALGEWQQLSAA